MVYSYSNTSSMHLTKEIKDSIEKSVLCWLATASVQHIPNVSPKEAFHYYGDDKIIVANIASPKTVKNIKQNENVCISFLDVFVQKGFQVKGKARIVGSDDPSYAAMEQVFRQMIGDKFPFKTITEITAETVKPIIAPSYLLYPDTTEQDQIESAKKTYGVQ
jgi:predicted pyridoxine 5'-phosphate oxidase superfamily flavin-nucleotide-binding protein